MEDKRAAEEQMLQAKGSGDAAEIEEVTVSTGIHIVTLIIYMLKGAHVHDYLRCSVSGTYHIYMLNSIKKLKGAHMHDYLQCSLSGISG